MKLKHRIIAFTVGAVFGVILAPVTLIMLSDHLEPQEVTEAIDRCKGEGKVAFIYSDEVRCPDIKESK